VEWDVMGGVARRAWARSEAALETAAAWNAAHAPGAAAAPWGHITIPHLVEDRLAQEYASGPAPADPA
jgi:urocanate hydratase